MKVFAVLIVQTDNFSRRYTYVCPTLMKTILPILAVSVGLAACAQKPNEQQAVRVKENTIFCTSVSALPEINQLIKQTETNTAVLVEMQASKD